MPMCQAYGCSNKPGGSGGEKRSFFAIPNPETDRERCARWLVNIGTDKYDIKTYKYCKNRVVCEEHFEAECFKEDMCAKVLGYKTTKKMLKPDAVPTIFVHRPRASQRETSRQRQERSERKEVLNTLLLDAAGQSTATLNQQTTNDPHDADESDFMDAAHVDVPEPCEFATVVTKSTEKRKLTTVDDMVRRKKRRRRQSGRNNGNIVDSSTQTTLPFCITSVSSLQHEVEYFDASTQFPEPDALPPHHESDHDTYGAPLPDHPAQIHLDLNAILQEEIQQQERKTETEQQEREEETEQQEREEEIKSASSVSQPLSEGRTIPTSPIFITPASVRQPESPEPPCLTRTKSSSDHVSSSPMQSDSSYVPSDPCPSEPEEEYEIEAPFHTACVEQPKYLVFEENLDQLFDRLSCKLCNCPVDEKKKSTSGTLLRVKVYCTSGHVILNWASQPIINQTGVGNILCAAATIFSGNTEKHVRDFTKILGLQFIQKTTFYDYQANLLLPVINEYYINHITPLRAARTNQEVEVCGDGRCDSPGYSAKFCTYSMMDRHTNEIIASELVQVSETTSSVAMEKVGFEKCMDSLDRDGVVPSLVATDRHVGIRALIKRKYPNITHQFDVWHLAKSVKKKLVEASKKRSCQELSPWIQSVSNHLWWCADSCGGDADLLVEMWTSLTYHITDQHEWESGQHFHQCAHKELGQEERASKAWLQSGSPAHEALNEVIFARQILQDVRLLTRACHTGELEVFHGALLKYCPKRQAFDYVTMQARTQLAILDHNLNANRKQAVVHHQRAGTAAKGALRFTVVWSKSTKRWVLKKVNEVRKYEYLFEMMEMVVRKKVNNEPLAAPVVPVLPRNIAPVPAPSKEELLQQFETRFSRV